MIFLFAHETYYVKGERTQVTPRLKSLFGIGNTHVPKRVTLVDQCKTLTSLIVKLPLLLTGRELTVPDSPMSLIFCSQASQQWLTLLGLLVCSPVNCRERCNY